MSLTLKGTLMTTDIQEHMKAECSETFLMLIQFYRQVLWSRRSRRSVEGVQVTQVRQKIIAQSDQCDHCTIWFKNIGHFWWIYKAYNLHLSSSSSHFIIFFKRTRIGPGFDENWQFKLSSQGHHCRNTVKIMRRFPYHSMSNHHVIFITIFRDIIVYDYDDYLDDGYQCNLSQGRWERDKRTAPPPEGENGSHKVERIVWLQQMYYKIHLWLG